MKTEGTRERKLETWLSETLTVVLLAMGDPQPKVEYSED
jgi:hypothetical protein